MTSNFFCGYFFLGLNNWVNRSYCHKVQEFIIIVCKLGLTWEIARNDFGVFLDIFVMEFYYQKRDKQDIRD